MERAEFIRLRGLEYVHAARTMGAGHWHLIRHEILPNAMAPLVVSATLVVGVAILFEAGLSFLGLSDPNVMSWGMMIGANRRHILECWWAVTLPGAAIFFTVLSVSLVGDGLNDGPVLAGADVSFALGQAVPLAQSKADFVLMGGQLEVLVQTLLRSRQTLRIVKQNLLWAALYNAACIPLALMGYLPAWAAGLGMALSSLLVVLNALRLSQDLPTSSSKV